MKRSWLVARGTGRGTAHLRNRCNDGHNRHWTLASVQAARPQHWAGLLLTHWFRVRPPGAPPVETSSMTASSWIVPHAPGCEKVAGRITTGGAAPGPGLA